MSLDAAALLEAAQAETGLHDYGDPTLSHRFAVAVDHLNALGLDAGAAREAAGSAMPPGVGSQVPVARSRSGRGAGAVGNGGSSAIAAAVGSSVSSV